MSAAQTLVDWSLAGRVSAGVTDGLDAVLGRGPRRGSSRADPYSADAVERACAEAIGLATEYTGLGTVSAPPVPELVDRREWAQNALGTLAEAARPLEQRVAADLSLPGPLGALARSGIRAAAGVEAGVAVGYVARRVLGQYDFALFGAERPARLLFVGENMSAAERELGADPQLFLRWVALHETTHVVQLERVPWLASHLRTLAGELIEGASAGLDSQALRELGRRVLRDPRGFVRTVVRGELSRALADPELGATLDRLQATMSVVEGHAEHVMDVASPELGPGIAALRGGLERRRARRGGIGAVIGRLLGIDLKLRQYELGKRFCDAVVATHGRDGLRLVWRSAADLPSLEELERPDRWLERVTEISAQPA